jgi:hypothetical protein
MTLFDAATNYQHWSVVESKFYQETNNNNINGGIMHNEELFILIVSGPGHTWR